jgi:hypothetical protein
MSSTGELTKVCAVGVGGGTLERAPSEESLDKFTRLSGFSNFTECSRGGWTLDISTIQGQWMLP